MTPEDAAAWADWARAAGYHIMARFHDRRKQPQGLIFLIQSAEDGKTYELVIRPRRSEVV